MFLVTCLQMRIDISLECVLRLRQIQGLFPQSFDTLKGAFSIIFRSKAIRGKIKSRTSAQWISEIQHWC